MKKISILMAMAAVALGFSSCEDSKDPVYQQPAEGSFVLNTPALANQYFELGEDNTLEFTTSQPEYGFVASVNYSMQMAMSANPAEDAIFDLTTAMPTSAVMTVKASDVAMGMCKLMGIDTEETWAAYDGSAQPVYFRAVAMLPGHDDTMMKSNWVELKAVKPYFAVPTPGYIYLIGDCGGWVGPDEGNAADLAPWRLYEANDAIGSKIYTGTFAIPAGKAMFRFYTELNGWGDDGCPWGLGYQAADAATDFEIENGVFKSDLVYGKGSFNFPGWQGGTMRITVNLASATPTMIIEAFAGDVPDTPVDPVDPGTPFKVYFDNAGTGWTTPYVHFWGGKAESSWPGNAMTNVSGDIWVYEVPEGTTGLVFNNSEGDQTSDFSAIADHVYNKSGDQGVYGN